MAPPTRTTPGNLPGQPASKRHRTNPACPLPATAPHRSIRAWAAGCGCDGDGKPTGGAVPARNRRWPGIHQAGRSERAVRARTDLPCRDEDPDLFFPVSDGGRGTAQAAAAKRVCRRCPVQADCLAAAIERGDTWGVLGATTAEERRGMRARWVA